MRGFRFRLEPVLRLRRNELRLRRRELAESLAALERAERARDEAAERLRRGRRDFEARLRRGLPGREVERWSDGVERASAERTRWREAADQAAKRVEQARRRVVEAHREVRLLERLRARALAAHRREEERREQLALDEVGSTRWWRRRSAG